MLLKRIESSLHTQLMLACAFRKELPTTVLKAPVAEALVDCVCDGAVKLTVLTRGASAFHV